MFARYEPRSDEAEPRAPCPAAVRHAEVADAAAVAGLMHARQGGDLAAYTEMTENEIVRMGRDDENLLLVADVDGDVVGFGRARYWAPDDNAPENTAPAGWYLTGVIVSEAWRRRGIAGELTRARLHWIGDRAEDAWYFASAMNRPTIDLHAPFGFEEVTRDFHFPRVTFTGGVGVLFRASLRTA